MISDFCIISLVN